MIGQLTVVRGSFGGDFPGPIPNYDPSMNYANNNFGVAVTPQQFGALCNGVLTHDASMSAPTNLSWGGQSASSSTTATAPAQTTTGTNSKVLTVIGYDGKTLTPPSGPTARVSVTGTSSYDIWLGDTTQATAGTLAAQSGTLSTATDNYGISIYLTANSGTPAYSGTASTCQTGNNTLCTLAVPSGTAAGDILVTCVDEFSANIIPRGTASGSLPSGGKFTYAGKSNGNSGINGYCYTRVAQAGDLSSSFSFNAEPSSQTAFLADYKTAGSPPAPTTSSTITSATAAFTQADVGYPVCVGNASNMIAILQSGAPPINTHLCGTISSVSNSTTASLSFGNLNEAGLTNAELRFGHDDTTAINNVFTSFDTYGGSLTLPTKACVVTGQLTVPAGVSVNIAGSGSSRNMFANQPTVENSTTNGSALWWLSDSVGGPGITVSSGGNGYLGWLGHDWWHDFTMWFGAGLDMNGGGSTSVNGIDVEGVSLVLLEHMNIMNAGGNCVQVDTTNSGSGWVDTFRANGDVFEACGQRGMQWNGGPFQVSMENMRADDTTIENNGLDGISVTGDISALTFRNDTIQRDNNNAAASISEITLPTTIGGGCGIDGGMYFEVDGQSMIANCGSGTCSNPINDPAHLCYIEPNYSNFSSFNGFGQIPSQTVYYGGQNYIEGTAPSCIAGEDCIWADSTAHWIKGSMNNGTVQWFQLSPYARTSPTGDPTTSGMVDSSTTGGVESWVAEQSTLSWDGFLGEMTTSARKAAIMPNAGHFTNLTCTATFTGTCTTTPKFNVVDITGSTSGTQTAGVTSTVATLVSQSQTLTFNAGDTVGISVSSAGATCTVPQFSCVATYEQP